ncbi:MAG: SoxR reducing system RseC family protein [Spirochaetales bacterium]|nr:SoxR reducing system RseC family protein [Spirochaetales bacterium]
MTRFAVITAAESGPRAKNNDVPTQKSNTSRQFWGVRERDYPVKNPQGLSFSVGDVVEIFLPSGSTVASSALTFLFPLAMFPTGFLLASHLLPQWGENGAFLVGFASLLVALPLSAVLRKFLGLRNAVPEVLRVLPSWEKYQCQDDACGTCGLCGGKPSSTTT